MVSKKQTYEEYKSEQDIIASKTALKQTIGKARALPGRVIGGLGLDKPTKISKKQLRFIQRSPMPFIARELSKGQSVLQELMGGSNQMWGTGQNLPKVDRVLSTGHGLINNGDGGETGRIFGFG